MKIVLIPCGTTEWHGQGRLLGRAELTLNADGQTRCAEWVQALGDEGISRILHAPDELASQTARFIARRLSVPTKALDALREVDLGLWAGLTEAQLKTRYASAHRELCEAPLNVNPPGGEAVSEAAQRIAACLRKQTRRKNNGAIGVVMRPLARVLAQCALQNREPEDLLEEARQAGEPVTLEYEMPAEAPLSE